MLGLIDTPKQVMFTLSIENDSSQSEFLIDFDNSALVNGPDLFGSGGVISEAIPRIHLLAAR